MTAPNTTPCHDAAFHDGAPAPRLWPVVVVCLVVWGIARFVFFTGLTGSDDMYYMRYAALWDRAPANHWEARLIGNALIRGSMGLFGRNEVAAAIPSLAASFVILGATLYAAHRYVGRRAALWAGLLVATLPIDVYLGTTISPFPVMTALMTVGTLAFLESPRSGAMRFTAAACLALGAVTHLSGVYYVAGLAVAALLIDRKRYGRVVGLTVVAGVVAVAADMVAFYGLFGDALGRFRVCLADANNLKPIMPTLPDGGINPKFILVPFAKLLFSKAFGVSMIAAVVVGATRFRRLSKPLRILWLTIVVVWVWMSFGSQIPWSYRPFWRMSRFLQPLTLAVALLFATGFGASPIRRSGVAIPVLARTRRWFGAAVIGVCAVNLAGAGSWGQNVTISRELLDYARAHPDATFLTDYHTLNEMYALSGMIPVDNVVSPDAARFRLIDPNAGTVASPDADGMNAILLNPLNAGRTNDFETIIARHRGELRWSSQTTHRLICRIVPPLKRFDWAVRKPPAFVFARKSAILATDRDGARPTVHPD